MNAFVQKWGNSLALRIPSALAKEIHLKQDSMVDLLILQGSMIVKPNPKTKVSLGKMLKKITKKNLHTDTQWNDAPVGKEIW